MDLCRQQPPTLSAPKSVHFFLAGDRNLEGGASSFATRRLSWVLSSKHDDEEMGEFTFLVCLT